jgi:trans-2,3-dihydro-3-hydroxyanthranilate isomerase
VSERPFLILDVFTDRRYAGNQLAVLPEAEGLADDALQAIAREFNFSETVFILPATRPGCDLRFRIFTPACEIPFAGHPTIGGAVAAARLGLIDDIAVIEEPAGPVRVDIRLDGARAVGAAFLAPQPPLILAEHGSAPLASALGLLANGPVVVASAGTPFAFLRVPDRATLRRLAPPAGLERLVPEPALGLVLWCPGETPGVDRHVRMFAPGAGVVEDPATGSAAAAMAALVHAAAPGPDGERRLVLSQGDEVGRPSLLELGVIVEAGRLRAARVGGGAVVVAEGRLRPPDA